MSLYGAMMAGISALDANANAMGIFSSNISNVNTIGYKDVTAAFSTLLTQMFNPNNESVISYSQQNVTQQGLLQNASSPTDLAVSGNGLFVVNSAEDGSGTQLYTRAGNFNPDANGVLQNGAGFYLMGWPIQNGVVQNQGGVVPVNVSDLSGKAQATSNITLAANLDSSATVVPFNPTGNYQMGDMTSGTVTPDFSTTVNVYDSLGGTEPVTIKFVKTDSNPDGSSNANTWAYEIDYSGTNPIGTGLGSIANLVGAGTVTFGSDGSIQSLTNWDGTNYNSGTSVNINIPFTGDLAPQTIAMNVGTIPNGTNGLTQFASASVVNNTKVDGANFGNLTGISVDKNGIVTANFSNGVTEQVFQIPLATFTNENGLAPVSGNAYEQSNSSGAANINAAGTGNNGTVASSELEGSTVDLATEFTNLITTQRAYSASARIVTTADQMLSTLEQIPAT